VPPALPSQIIPCCVVEGSPPTPYLGQVEAEVLEELRGPKIIVYKMKPKKHYRRKNGHRQDLTKFQITSISA
jgi:ribosomal protein L21